MSAERYRYRVYDLIVETGRRFRTPMSGAPAQGPADVHFRCVASRRQRTLKDQNLIFASSGRNEHGESAVQIYTGQRGHIVRFPRIADFIVGSGEVICELHNPRFDFMVEICLLGWVFALYLELRGMAVLHAGAVAVTGRALLFAADQAAGKTTMVTSMLAAGSALLCDDVAALEQRGAGIVCRRSFPQLKLAPRQAGRFLGHADGFAPVHPAYVKLSVPVETLGDFAPVALPVGRIYLLDRRPVIADEEQCGWIKIETLSAGEALMQLVRTSFIAALLESRADFRSRRLPYLAQIVRQVPVKRLSYPSGYKHLSAVHDAIRADLNAAPAERAEV